MSELPGGGTLTGLLEGNSGSKTQWVGAEPCLDPALSCVSFLLHPQMPWEQATSTAPAVPVLRRPEAPLPISPPPPQSCTQSPRFLVPSCVPPAHSSDKALRLAVLGEMNAKQLPYPEPPPSPEAGENQSTSRGKSDRSPPTPSPRTLDSQSLFLLFFQGKRGRWLETLAALTARLVMFLGTGSTWAKAECGTWMVLRPCGEPSAPSILAPLQAGQAHPSAWGNQVPHPLAGWLRVSQLRSSPVGRGRSISFFILPPHLQLSPSLLGQRP